MVRVLWLFLEDSAESLWFQLFGCRGKTCERVLCLQALRQLQSGNAASSV